MQTGERSLLANIKATKGIYETGFLSPATGKREVVKVKDSFLLRKYSRLFWRTENQRVQDTACSHSRARNSCLSTRNGLAR